MRPSSIMDTHFASLGICKPRGFCAKSLELKKHIEIGIATEKGDIATDNLYKRKEECIYNLICHLFSHCFLPNLPLITRQKLISLRQQKDKKLEEFTTDMTRFKPLLIKKVIFRLRRHEHRDKTYHLSIHVNTCCYATFQHTTNSKIRAKTDYSLYSRVCRKL